MVLIPYDQFINPDTNQEGDTPYQQAADNTSKAEKMSRDLILIPFGKNHFKHANTLLSYVERNMDWNQNGEIVIQGETIPASHITDLLKDAMYAYKNFTPIGYAQFYQNLFSVPTSLIRNPNRKYLVGKGSSRQNIPPPPGLPINQTAIPINSGVDDWKSSWKTM